MDRKKGKNGKQKPEMTEEAKQEREAMRTTYLARIQTVLTPEQFAKYEQLKKDGKKDGKSSKSQGRKGKPGHKGGTKGQKA